MVIYETAIYDGALKVWKVLCLNTGTFYGAEYSTQEEALASIKVGEIRNYRVVQRVKIMRVADFLIGEEILSELT